jgi:hypothetical protein
VQAWQLVNDGVIAVYYYNNARYAPRAAWRHPRGENVVICPYILPDKTDRSPDVRQKVIIWKNLSRDMIVPLSLEAIKRILPEDQGRI